MAKDIDARFDTAESLQLALRCQFDKALELAGEAYHHVEVAKHIDSLRAQARVHVLRGYTQRAKDCLDVALTFCNENVTAQQRMYLKMHWLYVNAACCGEPNLDYDILDEAAEYLQRLVDLQDHSRDDVEMRSQVHRIVVVHQNLYGTQPSVLATNLSTALSPLVKQAYDMQSWTDLYTLLIPYSALLDDPSLTAAQLEEMLTSTIMPELTRALLNLELVEQLIKLSRFSDIACHLSEAEQAFNCCDHAFGRLEVRRRRLEHGIEAADNPLQALVFIFVEYLEADYAFGVLYAAMAPLRLATQQADYRLYLQLQQSFRVICTTAGIKHERLLLELTVLATMNLSTSYNAGAIDLGRALWMECCQSQYWNVAVQVGKVLSLAHNQAGNNHEAERQARAVLEISEKYGLERSCHARYHLATILSTSGLSDVEARILRCREVIGISSSSYGEEAEQACQKLQLKAQMAAEMCRLSPSERDHWTAQMLQYMNENKIQARRLSSENKLDATGNCDDVHISYLLWCGRQPAHSTDNEHEDEAIRLCDALIDGYEGYDNKFRVAIKHMLRATCHLAKFQKSRLVTDIMSSDRDYAKAGDLLEQLQMAQLLLNARHCQLRNHVELFFGVPGFPSDTMFALLNSCETVVDELRQELSTFRTLEALLAKQNFANNPQVQAVYSWAARVTLKEEKYDQLWLWSQKRKARSLSDMLGLGVLVPETIKSSIGEETEFRELLGSLQSKSAALAVSSAAERTYLRQEIADIENKLGQNTAFDEFIRLRNGAVKGISQLESLHTHDQRLGQQRRVLFADWMIQQNKIYVLVYDCNRVASGQLLDTGLLESQVGMWLATHFTTNDDRKRCLDQDTLWAEDRPLRQLDALVKPLADISEPGDILVFSVTSLLASIPLHILGMFDDEGPVALLERNPVVYTPSFPTLEVCLARSVARDTSGQSLFAGAFDNSEELVDIKQQMFRLAEAMKGHAFTPSSKRTFEQHVERAPLVHFHGHCIYQAANILSQALVFEKEEGATAISKIDPGLAIAPSDTPLSVAAELLHYSSGSDRLMDSDEATQATHLTVEDIFNLKFAANPLMVLIACESGSQVLSTGDEPLGLIASLLCAGASSVISASWKVPSGTGRAFSAAFYEQMIRGPDEHQEDSFIDVAVALQQAMLAVRDFENEYGEHPKSSPYHWGSFSLHGSWLYKRQAASPLSVISGIAI